ncbi:TlpA disulfide reductase family protein [Thiohalophilus sp.]|uniref:peroxiredoxin family protein n=1 Tax=Thiohalophilus sp. TaxID=3028392 RepID=UPI002ACD5F16|nr:TlpA disulfide reductase family protein [Thiohalophilus sp.]MDZ7804849.1 TlpA disulfide reductase family protein [Thiohalophilus sp.]
MTLLPRSLLAIFLLFISCTWSYAETGHRVGQTAPGFELTSLEGDKVSLDSLTQQGHVLLVFWATECVYCYAHISDFNALHDHYHDRGLTVAAINIAGEYAQEVREYARSNDLKYLVLADRLDNLDVAEDYHVVGTPTLVLVNPENRILFYGHNLPDVGKWLKE